MGLIKKKGGVGDVPAPVAALDLVMHASTTLNADEKSESCFALFQTDKPLSAVEWVSLAQAAREGFRFTLVVTKDDKKE